MRAKPIPFDQQLQLIMECRSSGLTDYQWCQEHDINPGTFYNWVKRHRQKACGIIPGAEERMPHPAPASRQEVVRIDPKQFSRELVEPKTPELTVPMELPSASGHTLEIELNGAVLRASNDISPGLLAQTLRILRGMPC